MNFTYLEQPPKLYTFEQPELKKWTERWCTGKVLNLFAGTTHLLCDEYRVDLDAETHPDFNGDAYDFVTKTDKVFDTVVFDPPYNLRKSREKYNGRYIGSLTKIKNELTRIMQMGSIIIHFGYDTVGMGRGRGFEKVAVCIVCHNGDHNDTICLVERKISEQIEVVFD